MSKIDSYSVSLKGNTQRVKLNGCCSLYLRVLVNCKKLDIPLGIDWPVKLIDNKNGLIKPKSKTDLDWQDHQIIIQTQISKVNEVFKIYRIQELPLTIARLQTELKAFDKRGCFLAFFLKKTQERFDIGEIDTQTMRNHKAAHRTLFDSQQDKHLPFIEVNEQLFNNYKKYCKKEKKHTDETCRGRIAIFKKYLRLAKKTGIHIDADVLDYTIGQRNRRLVWLTNPEIVSMMNQLNNPLNTDVERLSLQAFLFSCFTGLRASDLCRAHHNWITIKNELDFTIKKNSRNRPKRLVLPLTDIARSFIPTYSGLFFNIEPQTINEKIKIVAKRAGINKHITLHVARHTFGSSFIDNGGEVTVLQQLMGHSKIKDTMIYVHIQDALKRSQMDSVHKTFTEFKNLSNGYPLTG